MTSARILEHPERYGAECFGISSWYGSRKILTALRDHAHVVAYGCHSSGKTHTGAFWDIRHVQRWKVGRVVLFAPGHDTLKHVVWPELHEIHGACKYPLPDMLDTQWKIPGYARRGIIGRATDKGVKFRGTKAGRMHLHIEEWNGIKDEHAEEIESLRAGGTVTSFRTFNPTRAAGPAYQAVTELAHRFEVVRITGWEVPNLIRFCPDAEKARAALRSGDTAALRDMALPELLRAPLDEGGPLDDDPRPYLLRARTVREWVDDYGLEHPFVVSRVDAEFPSGGDDLVFDLALLERAKRQQMPDRGGKLVAAIDVAGGGRDFCTLSITEHGTHDGRPYKRLHSHDRWATADPRDLVISKLTARGVRERLCRVNVETAGLGHFWPQDLTRAGVPHVVKYEPSAPARQDNQYINRKAEAFWDARRALEAGEVYGLTDEIIGQLAPFKWDATKDRHGRIAVVDKSLTHASSPDDAESWVPSLDFRGGTRFDWGQDDSTYRTHTAGLRGREW